MEETKIHKADLDRTARLILALVWEYGEKMKPGLHRQCLNEIKFLQFKIDQCAANKRMEEQKNKEINR